MKRFILLCSVVIVFITTTFSANVIRINENVTLEIREHEYVIDFSSPYFEEQKSVIQTESGEYVFSKIVFGKDREDLAKYGDANDIFDGNEGVGVPGVPFFPLSLQMPEGARYDVRIEGGEYLNKYTGDVSDSEMLYYLSNDYVPSQQYSADEKLREIQFDRKEYAKDKYNELYTISEPFGAMGTIGVTLTISPFIYFPQQKAIAPIQRARIVIDVDSEISLNEMMDKEINNVLMATSGAYIYDNYLGTTKKSTSTTDKGRYLIITTSTAYADALTSYITHKRNYGYDVMLHVQNGGYANATALRNYIKSMYDNIGSRPQYVLLVGNYNQIPFSYGVMNDKDNPPTDIYYACLEKAEIGTESNFYPEVYIGRWPVSSSTEITKIANKVINFEQHTNYSRIFELYSGTGDYHKTFESDNKKAADKLADIHLATVRNFKGSDGVNDSVMKKEFVNYNVLMMVYNGHGASNSLGSPYTAINSYTISSLVSTPYYMVGFACKLNYPTLSSFGSTWIRNGYRTLAFYGSTVNTTTGSDTYLSKHMFDYFKSVEANITYSQFMQMTAARYYNALKNATRRKETKKYLFLGDPTVYTLGMTAYNGNPKAYMPKLNDSNASVEQTELSENEHIISVNVYNALGQIIVNANSLNYLSDLNSILEGLNSGTYIVRVVTTEREITQKIHK